ncbi:MAG: sugar transferase [Clostridia bacterium]|nr:sugar transferase [Clostridia bacterium]MBP3706030.1 sugar transferase [Clostridia bacterium]
MSEKNTVKAKKGFYESYIKCPLDFTLALLALVLLSPILLVVGIIVGIRLGFPIIFKQERAGKDGKPFYIYKFRSMSNKTDSNGALLPDEERLDKFGKMLRSTSLDELPSFLNVLKFDMSLVGPRCLYMRYNSRYNEHQARRLEVRPGITGLAQINGRNSIYWDKKFNYDVKYVDNITFSGDMKILFKTVGRVLKRADITSSTSVTMEEFMGNENKLQGAIHE